MFGRDKMTHNGTATVISSSDAAHHVMWQSGGYDYSKYDMVLDVYPQGAPPFRAAAEASFAIFYSPSPGDVLNVQCNPETGKVKVDTDDDPRWNVKLHSAAMKAERVAERERDLAVPPGTPPAQMSAGPMSGGQFGANLQDPELVELMRLEEDERRRGTPPS